MTTAAWSERRVAALCELVAAVLLLSLVAAALLLFFRFFDRPGLGLGRYAFLPAGLVAGAVFAALRARRALRKMRAGSAG